MLFLTKDWNRDFLKASGKTKKDAKLLIIFRRT